MAAMRFGFYLPTRGPAATPDAIAAVVTRAESLGFHSVMIADHLVIPIVSQSKYPYTLSGAFPDGNGDALDQLALMAFVAARTESLRLVTSVMILPHRNPIVAAKALATIDLLSKGRVTVGIGVGWFREEFEALRAPEFDRRGAVTDEYIRIFKNLWTEDPSSFDGKFYSYAALRCRPKPVQTPHPPIWVGGESEAALRRVARLCDGWHPIGANPAAPLGPVQLAEKLATLRRLTEQAGRDYNALTICYKVPVYDAGEPVRRGEARRPFAGTAADVLADIAQFAALGVGELVFDFRSPRVEESLARMEDFASSVLRPATV
jgi:probable F420-dependent oxidoreductase